MQGFCRLFYPVDKASQVLANFYPDVDQVFSGGPPLGLVATRYPLFTICCCALESDI